MGDQIDYREIDPHPHLAGVVRCFWTLESSALPDVERLVPDGCPEVVLNLGDPFEQMAASGGIRQPTEMAVGQIERVLSIRATGVVRLLGVRFQPYGLTSLLGVPGKALTEERVALSDLDHAIGQRLTDAATGADSTEEALRAVEREIGRELETRRRDPTDIAIARAVAMIEAARGFAPASAVASRAGLGLRQFQRRFGREVGLTPKRFSRIVRFQGLLVGARETGRPPDAGLALDHGYYDQSHMIRDFRQFTGRSPGGWFAEEHGLAEIFSDGDVAKVQSPSAERS